MRIIIQKFGGTSLATNEGRLACIQRIEEAINNGFTPVVVVSAIGRSGDPYATDTLIKFLNTSCDNVEPRELDQLLSCGELISSVIFCSTLNSKGYSSISLTGSQAEIITDASYGNANILRIEKENILYYLSKGIIPVVTGFQGITEKGDITTLGRGGSDVTAAILGEALSAEIIEIYTDVDGIMTVDPKFVPKAKPIDKMFYYDAFRMAEYGAKVIHKRAVHIAMRSNIPLIIKNTTNNSQGTTITSTMEIERNTEVAPSITAITHSDNYVIISIVDNIKIYNTLFGKLEEAGVEIFMTNLTSEKNTFLINNSSLNATKRILNELGIAYKKLENLSCITLIGNSLLGITRIISKVTQALCKNNIPILQTSNSHGAISCVIESSYGAAAISALHSEFELS